MLQLNSGTRWVLSSDLNDNCLAAAQLSELSKHPTMYPQGLAEHLIFSGSHPREPFTA